jgi:pimeloyl-ACP methyl ester carboxylesterase
VKPRQKPSYHPFRSAEAREKYLKLYDKRAKKWPVASESIMVDTSCGQTFVRLSGPAGARPLVLLHGVSGNSLQWIPNIRALSQNFRTYALDNIYDKGRSIYTKPITSADDFVNWLEELFKVLDLGDKINLMGLSYGGWITAQYALRFPKRLNKIVLIAPAGTILPISFKWIVRAVLCAIPLRYFTRSFMYWLLKDLTRQGPSGRAFLEESVDEAYLAFRSFKPKRLVNPTVLTDEEWRMIEAPALYLVGENEKIYPARKAIRRLNEVAPQIKTELIPQAGHDLTIVQVEMINNKVLEFLNQPRSPVKP